MATFLRKNDAKDFRICYNNHKFVNLFAKKGLGTNEKIIKRTCKN